MTFQDFACPVVRFCEPQTKLFVEKETRTNLPRDPNGLNHLFLFLTGQFRLTDY